MLTIPEVAILADCNQNTVRRAVQIGKLPANLHPSGSGPMYRITEDAASIWIGQRRRLDPVAVLATCSSEEVERIAQSDDDAVLFYYGTACARVD